MFFFAMLDYVENFQSSIIGKLEVSKKQNAQPCVQLHHQKKKRIMNPTSKMTMLKI